ncbi:hypothetical protein E0E54_18295 [Azotobacter chroococcum]|uniref:hypothetical protein n=1 Tax=Azotobacter chroococcum TaxID=353 RepID=UPI00103FD0FE|nr:hypothetical protein [Azotobacter chroococcum]TBW32777.1 hypothetical protein E0E54_18295 [Azotobacter chroococcum]
MPPPPVPDRDFKTALRSGPVSHDKDKASLLDKAMAFMNTLGTLPDKVMAYFRHPAARYAWREFKGLINSAVSTNILFK